MCDQLFERLGHRYIAAMLLATRLCGSIGGVLVVYYVNLTLTLPEPMRTHFIVSCAVVVVLAVILSLLMCAVGDASPAPVAQAAVRRRNARPRDSPIKAGREAVVFPVRHHRNEAWLVPATHAGAGAHSAAVLDDASIETLQQRHDRRVHGHRPGVDVHVLHHRAADAAGGALSARQQRADRLRAAADRTGCSPA